MNNTGDAMKHKKISWLIASLLVSPMFTAMLAGQAAAAASSPSAPTVAVAPSAAPSTARERLSLDRGWLFHLGDIVSTVGPTTEDAYLNAKAGNARGAAGDHFDDKA